MKTQFFALPISNWH